MKVRQALVVCDAGASMGMGHLMRSIAIAEQATSIGWQVAFAGELNPTAKGQIEQRVPEASISEVAGDRLGRARLLAAVIDSIQPDVIHVDSYRVVDIPHAAELVISNMQDGEFGARRADLAIDANLGAENRFHAPELSRWKLAGGSACISRSSTRELANRQPLSREAGPNPRVLIVFGGTDATSAAPRLLSAINRLNATWSITVVAAPHTRRELESESAGSHHRIAIVDFVDDLPRLAQQHDLTICSASSTVWDLAPAGTPMALMVVANNQRPVYDNAVSMRIAVGLSRRINPRMDAVARSIEQLLAATDQFESMSIRARAAIDGLGAWRVAVAWDRIISGGARPVHGAVPLPLRPATLDDARILFSWRNDPTTRTASRTQQELDWDIHIAWLEDTLADSRRNLFIARYGREDVGTVRLDRLNDVDWVISLALAPGARGRGLGRPLLSSAHAYLTARHGAHRVVAEVHSANIASQRIFDGMGYLPYLPTDADGFETLARLDIPARLGDSAVT